MPPQYYPVIIIFAVAGFAVVVMLVLAMVLGPYRPTHIKNTPFECGNPSTGTQRRRLAVKYFVVAILFVLFDIEIAFLYPWAVKFKEFGWLGFVELITFVAIITGGLAYVWRKGALTWEE